MTCTTEACDNETRFYICEQCVRDLQAWIDKGRELLPDLDVTIARLDNVRPTNSEGNNGTKSAGSAAPLNIDAMQLRWNLMSMATDASTYATDEHAAGIASLIQLWVTNAELAISGPEDEHIDHAANRAKLEADFPEPAPRQEACNYIAEHMGINIRKFDFENWVKRRKLRYVLDRIAHPRLENRLYFPVDILRTHQKTRQ